MKKSTKKGLLKTSAFMVAVGAPAGFIGYLFATQNLGGMAEKFSLTGGGIFGVILLVLAALKHFDVIKLKNIFSIDTIMLNLGILFLLLTPVISMVSYMFLATGGSLLVGKGLSK